MAEYIVRCRDLTKSYGTFCALNGVNVDIEKGKIVGLLGPNGSGKTTFIKILAGLLTVDEGVVQIDGHAPGTETKSIVSYLPERPYFNSWMKVCDCLDYFADFYSDFDRQRAEHMLKDLGISLTARLQTLSKGTKEKVQLILVMSRKAKLYLLDEPIGGVDPAARDYILKTIITRFDNDASVLISTHLIADIEDHLDRFILIHEGKVALNGEVKYVKEEKGMSLDEYFREVFKCSQSF
ncbi:MAG: ABC transporter ATP-binding protein [Clostridia bacterium]|nr:ABC transporter ATP-binding protein [Clostridia bacterium]